MEPLGGSDALRAAAPEWSLAGDRQLLALLHEIHQKIMTRCEDTSNKLEEMVTALDTASVALQNVNNRFMALSNSQFIESRVYDDDNDVTADCVGKKKASPPASAPAAAPSPLAGLLTLERLHEPVQICEDSDSDTGSDQPTTIILKPRDPYSARPLPHIIGSQSWKTKWHVGLLLEDSDPDSSAASRSHSPVQYSETESEPEIKPPPFVDRYRQSSGSSSERDLTQPAEAPSSQSVQPSQAEIAAELARRLGGFVEPPQSPTRTDDGETHTPVQRKLYKPQQPTSATIFSDEPPPLAPQAPSQESDVDVYSDTDEDIFAEINRKAPYTAQNKAQNPTNVDIFADLHSGDDEFGRKEPSPAKNKVQTPTKTDLFGDTEENDVFVEEKGRRALVNEIKAKVAANKVGSDRKVDFKQNKPLFHEPEESDLFEKKPERQGSGDGEKISVKKPAGAISLFGNNKDAASIGAAILNRNRKSSSGESNDGDSSATSGETESRIVNLQSDTNDRRNREDKQSNEKAIVKSSNKKDSVFDIAKPNASRNNETGRKEKDIVGDSVKQSERDIFDDLFEKSAKKEKSAVNVNKYDGSKKVDLFSDNIFDDIDDIFSSNVIIKKNTKNDKVKSIFDDDDGLFAEVDRSAKSKTNAVDELVKDFKRSEHKRLFDSDDDLFSSKKDIHSKQEDVIKGSSDNTLKTIIKSDAKTVRISDSDDELFSGEKNVPKAAKTDVRLLPGIPTKAKEDKSLFEDDDSEDNSIFSNIKTPNFGETRVVDNKITEKENIDVVSKESTENNNQNEVDTVKGPFDVKIDTNEVDSQGLHIDAEKSEADENCKMQTSTDSVKCDTMIGSKEIFGKLIENEQKPFNSPSIFDDDDDENLFTRPKESTKEKTESNINMFATKASEKTQTASEKTQSIEVKDGNSHKSIEVIKSPSIFDSDGDDDIFAKPLQKAKTIDVSNKEHEKAQIHKLESKPLYESKFNDEVKERSTMQVPDFNDSIDNATKNLDTNKNIEEKNILFTRTESSNTKNDEGPSIFDDIYTEPPVFEKPKEPKKSKNVNALFDDDSDDESLFFKKNDVISDEKVVDFSIANEEKVFTIFHDEPPAMDVDFGVNFGKGSKHSQQNVEIVEKPAKVDEKTINKTEKGDTAAKLPEKVTNIYEKHQTNDVDKTDGVIQSKKEPIKPVGKLKPMQFSINVNTLLPGASPKKVVKITPEPESQLKYEEETSEIIGEPTTSKIKPEQVASKLVKSASFEETPDSPVLDNKLSKDRAKIQVKRRPSTRRARKEAARKSAIDFVDGPDDDSQDSDVVSKNIEGEKNSGGYKDDVEENISVNNVDDKKIVDEINNAEPVATGTKNIGLGSSKDIDFTGDFQTGEVNNLDTSAGKDLSNISTESDESSKNITVIENNKPFQGTDEYEDLFKQKVMDIAEKITSNVEKQGTSSKITEKTRVLNINDVDVYIIKDTQVKEQGDDTKDTVRTEKEITPADNKTQMDSDAETEVQYIGRVYKKTDEQGQVPDESSPKDLSQNTSAPAQNPTKSEILSASTKKASLFDDLSDDDDLFGGKTKSQKSVQKNTSSNKENDEGLFATTSSIRKDTAKSVGVKKSLFGEEDDEDDDLFGVKRKTSREEAQLFIKRATSKAATTQAAPVFDDPLSMFGADEEES